MHVRSFQLSDASQMTELLQVALSEECYENTMGPFARQLSWDSDLIMVAEEEGDLVGALIGTIDHNQGCIYRIAVIQTIVAVESAKHLSRLWNSGSSSVKSAKYGWRVMSTTK